MPKPWNLINFTKFMFLPVLDTKDLTKIVLHPRQTTLGRASNHLLDFIVYLM